MELDTTLLNTQHYKVRFKGKVEQSWEWSSAPLHLGVVAIEKGAFGSPSTMVANFTNLYQLSVTSHIYVDFTTFNHLNQFNFKPYTAFIYFSTIYIN